MSKILFILFSGLVIAQIPDYYSSIDFNSTPESLRSQISDLITDTHTTQIPYTSSSTDTWDVIKTSDLDTNDSTQENVLLIYGFNDSDAITMNDKTRDRDLNQTSNTSLGLWNREHVFPRSIATPNMSTQFPGTGTDVHNLRSADAQMNSSRGNRIFAEGSGNSTITNAGNWFPGDEWKGDVARIIMYMQLRYPTQTQANNVAFSSNTFSTEMPDLFLQWNIEDPVSEFEINRNQQIFLNQGNRNPFIDNPYIATLIWGGNNAENTWEALNTSEFKRDIVKVDVFPNPVVKDVYYKTEDQLSSITIKDENGRTIDFNLNANNNKINLPNTKGVYFILFNFENGVQVVKKILKK